MTIFKRLVDKAKETKNHFFGRRDEDDDEGYYNDDEDGNTEPSTVYQQQIPEAPMTQPETDHRSYQRPGNVPIEPEPHQYGPGEPSYLWNPAPAEPSPLTQRLTKWTVYDDPNSNRDDVADLFGFANSPEELWNTFEQGEYHQISPDPEKNKKSFWKKWRTLIIVLAVVLIALIVIGTIAIFVNLGTNKTVPKETTAAATVSETAAVTTTVETTTAETTAVPTQTPQEAAVNDELTAASWENDWFNLTEVNLLEDKSTTADGAFYKAGVRTPDEIVVYLQSGTDSANALLASIIELTGSTKESVLDPNNWVAIQSNVDFTYPGNTGYVDGQIVDLGSRTGNKGDIFLGFVSPETGKIVFVRAACANPQAFTPVPNSPTPTPKPTPTPTTTLTPKNPSQDPAAQGNAPVGSGVNQNPGPGTYVAPTDMITPPAESRINPTPPVATTTTAAATTATTTAKVTVAIPTPTPVDVAIGDPTWVGTPAIPN